MPLSCLFILQHANSWRFFLVVAVNNVLRAPICLHLRNFETERYTKEKHEIKSFDLQEIYEFGFSFFVVSRFVPKLRKSKKNWSAQYIFD